MHFMSPAAVHLASPVASHTSKSGFQSGGDISGKNTLMNE